MKCLAFCFALWVPVAFGADTAADLQKKFVGSWKLVSIEGPNQQPIRGKPFGMIMYDNTGHMAVQIVRGERPAFPSPAKATDNERAQAYSTYTVLRNVRPIKPIPCSGRLGLWMPSSALIRKLPGWARTAV